MLPDVGDHHSTLTASIIATVGGFIGAIFFSDAFFLFSFRDPGVAILFGATIPTVIYFLDINIDERSESSDFLLYAFFRGFFRLFVACSAALFSSLIGMVVAFCVTFGAMELIDWIIYR